jgi:predicted transcriptional regulator
MADDLIINANELSGLELAKYVLLRLIDGETIEDIAKNFDNNKKFVSETLDLLFDIGWIKQDTNGNYRITTKGQKSKIMRRRPVVSLGG